MILNKGQIRNRFDKSEQKRREAAEDNTVQSLKIAEIKDRIDSYIPLRELRLEIKRRKERLRYLKIRSNPKTLSQYRARKRAEYAKRKGN